VFSVNSGVFTRRLRLELLDQCHEPRCQHDKVSRVEGFVRVRHASGNKDRLTRSDLDFSVSKAESQGTFEHVPRLVVGMVNVQLRRSAASPLPEREGLPGASESGGGIAPL